jgi:hypothetical protein
LDRIQVIPADGKQRVICDWMLDQEYCHKTTQDSPPIVSADALLALWKLLDAQTLLRRGKKAKPNASLKKKGASDAKTKANASAEEARVGRRKSVGRSANRKTRASRKTAKSITRGNRKGRQKGKRK